KDRDNLILWNNTTVMVIDYCVFAPVTMRHRENRIWIFLTQIQGTSFTPPVISGSLDGLPPNGWLMLNIDHIPIFIDNINFFCAQIIDSQIIRHDVISLYSFT